MGIFLCTPQNFKANPTFVLVRPTTVVEASGDPGSGGGVGTPKKQKLKCAQRFQNHFSKLVLR